MFFFKHSWVEFVRMVLVVVISVSKNVVLSETPRVDTVFCKNIAVVTSGGNLDSALSDFGGIVAFLEVFLPQLFNELGPVKILDVLQLVFFFFFD